MNTCSVAVSDAVADQTKNYPGRWKRIIANGVGPLASTTSREQVRSALELGEKARLVVHVGNIRPGKGHDALVETVLQLASTHPEVSFVSIGSEKIPGDLQRLRSRVRDLNLDDRLRFLGPRRDAIDFISAADVVINPSEVEGLPVAVLEALSLGRPVVATDVGGVSSVVIEGETGYLVAAGDTKALANRVGDLVGDSSERERMGRNGKQLMERNHSLADMVTQYETLYREVLDA
jgi:glycosyltransferase involved in cell wall biosynthesis